MIADGEGLAKDGDFIGKVIRNGDELIHTHLGIFGEAAVPVDAEEFQILTDMAQPPFAGRAVTAGDDRVHQNTLAEMEGSVIAFRQGFDGTENFMAEHAGNGGSHMLVTIDDHVRAADAAVANFNQRLVRPGNRHRNVGQFKIQPVFQYCCFHQVCAFFLFQGDGYRVRAACRCRPGCRRPHRGHDR